MMKFIVTVDDETLNMMKTYFSVPNMDDSEFLKNRIEDVRELTIKDVFVEEATESNMLTTGLKLYMDRMFSKFLAEIGVNREQFGKLAYNVDEVLKGIYDVKMGVQPHEWLGEDVQYIDIKTIDEFEDYKKKAGIEDDPYDYFLMFPKRFLGDTWNGINQRIQAHDGMWVRQSTAREMGMDAHWRVKK